MGRQCALAALLLPVAVGRQQRIKHSNSHFWQLHKLGKSSTASTLCVTGVASFRMGLLNCIGCTFLSKNVYTCRYFVNLITPPLHRHSFPRLAHHITSFFSFSLRPLIASGHHQSLVLHICFGKQRYLRRYICLQSLRPVAGTASTRWFSLP